MNRGNSRGGSFMSSPFSSGGGYIPGKPVAHNSRLLCPKNGLLWDVVACHFGVLGFPGMCTFNRRTYRSTHMQMRMPLMYGMRHMANALWQTADVMWLRVHVCTCTCTCMCAWLRVYVYACIVTCTCSCRFRGNSRVICRCICICT